MIMSSDEVLCKRFAGLLANQGLSSERMDCSEEALRDAIESLKPSEIGVVLIDGSNPTAAALAMNPMLNHGRFSVILLGAQLGPGLADADLRANIQATLSPQAELADLQAAIRVIAIAYRLTPEDFPEPLRASRTLRILVADDNRTNQRVVGKILSVAGHKATYASSGEEALLALEQGNIDLALMDVNMPVMTGLEVTRFYRVESLGQPHLPIVGLTADASTSMARDCLDSGMDAFLTKPVDPDALIAAIDRLVPEQEAVCASLTSAGTLESASIDWSALAGLEQLGGTAFMAELIEDFETECDELADELDAARRAGDPEDFRQKAHALQSAAGNVGARRLAALCHSWRHINGDVLGQQGNKLVRQLRDELTSIKMALDKHLQEAE
jgi:two-component system sensor histidine kinase RpfC